MITYIIKNQLWFETIFPSIFLTLPIIAPCPFIFILSLYSTSLLVIRNYVRTIYLENSLDYSYNWLLIQIAWNVWKVAFFLDDRFCCERKMIPNHLVPHLYKEKQWTYLKNAYNVWNVCPIFCPCLIETSHLVHVNIYSCRRTLVFSKQVNQ